MADEQWGAQLVGLLPQATIPAAPIDVLINQNLGSPPATHGVFLWSEKLTALPTTGTIAYYAEITFGAGVASGKFLCDWCGQFALVASRIEVRAKAYHTRAATDMIADPNQWRHAAAIGFGGWHSKRPLTFTGVEVALESATPSQVIDVPKLARRLFLRLGRLTSPVDDFNPAEAVAAADLQCLTLAISPTRNASSKYTAVAQLTPEMLRDGIDVSNAEYVTLVLDTVATTRFLFTPVFELSI